MKAYFIKRSSYLKDEKDVFLVTFLYGDVVTNSLVDKQTYDWFGLCVCGDEIPNDFVHVNLYQSKDGIKANIKLLVE